MKEFPQAVIEQTDAYFKGQKFPVEEARLGDLDISYYVIPQALSPELPDFAMRMTRTDEATGEVSGIFGVSDSVPSELRPYWAAHEIIEFTKIGIGKEGRCTEAEKSVVDLVPQNLKESYIARRTDFFTNLIGYFRKDLQAKTGNYTRGDLHEAVTSLRYLRSLAPKTPARKA